jgi:predicted PurR-regulated permease PerM
VVNGAARSQAFGRRLEAIAALVAVMLLAVGCVLVLRPFLSALLWAMILTYAT